jgi:hypothetical protein
VYEIRSSILLARRGYAIKYEPEFPKSPQVRDIARIRSTSPGPSHRPSYSDWTSPDEFQITQQNRTRILLPLIAREAHTPARCPLLSGALIAKHKWLIARCWRVGGASAKPRGAALAFDVKHALYSVRDLLGVVIQRVGAFGNRHLG